MAGGRLRLSWLAPLPLLLLAAAPHLAAASLPQANAERSAAHLASPPGPRSGGGMAGAAPRRAVLLLLPPVPFERALAEPALQRVATVGGSALMTTRVGPGDPEAAAYRTIAAGSVQGASSGATLPALLRGRVDVCSSLPPGDPASVLVRGAGPCSPGGPQLLVARAASVSSAREALDRLLRGSSLALVVAVSPRTSAAMADRGDAVTPVVAARGRPATILGAGAEPRALTSATTRRIGLVSNVDVAPTLLAHFGLPGPASVVGAPMRPTSAPAPFALHLRHLDHRRIRVPVQLAELAYVVAAGLAAMAVIAALERGHRLRPAVARAVRVPALLGAALPLAVLAAGALPRLTVAWVAPFVIGGTVLLGAVATAVGRGPAGPLAVVGAAGLAFLSLDAALGGRALGLPLFGGTMFDGVRYYGLPNGFIPLLLASALFVAAALPPVPGLALLVAAGLFAGLPSLGANLGASVTLFAAAGVWWVLRTRRRVGVREVSFVAGIVALGAGGVLLASRLASGPGTHVTRFVSGEGGGPGGVLDAAAARLAIGLRMVAEVPAAALPVAGLVAVLWLLLRRGGRVAGSLGPAWRDAVVTLSVAALVAYVANDTGPAAAGPAFLYAIAGIVYPATAAIAGRGTARAAPPPNRAGDGQALQEGGTTP